MNRKTQVLSDVEHFRSPGVYHSRHQENRTQAVGPLPAKTWQNQSDPGELMFISGHDRCSHATFALVAQTAKRTYNHAWAHASAT